jgi:hypothetical protein
MRRRDHEKIVHDKDREITYLRRQNENLLDKILHVTGHTWTLPPRNYSEDVELPDEFFTTNPEQFIDAVSPE